MLTLGILAICRFDLKVSYEQNRTFCCYVCILSSSPCFWGIRNFHKTQTHSAQGSFGQLLLEDPRLEGMCVRAHVRMCWRSRDRVQLTQRQWKHLLSLLCSFKKFSERNRLLSYLAPFISSFLS